MGWEEEVTAAGFDGGRVRRRMWRQAVWCRSLGGDGKPVGWIWAWVLEDFAVTTKFTSFTQGVRLG
jgi:hypothetical protein